MREIAAYAIVGLVCFFVGFLLNPVFSGRMISGDQLGLEAVDFINHYLLRQGEAYLVNVSNPVKLYPLYISVESQGQSQMMPLWVSENGLLFATGLNMTEYKARYAPQGEFDAPDSERPQVELFVMSFCPFGTQAEELLKPVVDLLKEKADFRVRYIVSISNGSVSSLHGEYEANEDLRQICIQYKEAEKFWDYLMRFNSECRQYAGDNEAVKNCSVEVMQELDIDFEAILECAEGKEGLDYLDIDESIASAYGISASPTLVVNGMIYSGERSPEAYKKAVCSGFVQQPEECSQELSVQSGSASGMC